MKDPKGPVKPYKTPEELSKKHKVPLSKILGQVKKGTKVEGEHTTSKKSAEITALQHVDEFPDYYDRLKKVEKKSMKEETNVEDQYKKDTKYCILCRKNEKQAECKYGPVMWERFTIAAIHPTNESLSFDISARRPKKISTITKADAERHSEKAADLHKKEREKTNLPNIKKEKTFEQFILEVAAWQRKAGKNPEGGLNEKGRKSYERENPGSNLKAPVTTEPSKLDPDSEPAKRRKSFCARMSGNKGPMKDKKGRPTRKALSLRKWNC